MPCIFVLFSRRKQKRNQKKAEGSPTAERRLLPPPAEEKVPDLVTTNGKMPIVARKCFVVLWWDLDSI